MIIDCIESQRLKARRLVLDDYDLLRQMHVDTLTMESLGGVRDEGETQDNLKWNLEQWQQHNVGLWVFFEKATDQFVGTAGLRHIDIEGIVEIDLAYALLSKYWQKGYGTEMSKACVDIGFNKYKFESIVAGTRKTNLSSQKVIEKLGFIFERTIFKFGHEQVIYRLSRNEWQLKQL